jgi:hypothetical protein
MELDRAEVRHARRVAEFRAAQNQRSTERSPAVLKDAG